MELQHLKKMLHALHCSFAGMKHEEVLIYDFDWVDRFPYNPAENYWMARHALHPAGIVLCDYTADDHILCFQTDVLLQALNRIAGDGLLVMAPASADCLQKIPPCVYLHLLAGNYFMRIFCYLHAPYQYAMDGPAKLIAFLKQNIEEFGSIDLKNVISAYFKDLDADQPQKRASVRVNHYTDACLVYEGQPRKVSMLDVSAGGARIVHNEKICRRTPVTLEFNLNMQGKVYRFIRQGIVVHAQKKETKYIAGIRFSAVGEQETDRLITVLFQILREKMKDRRT